nr:hypothetical protein [Prevotella sp. UBA4952]
MILTDYYRFERIKGTKAKLRIDCTASTGSYESLEEKRAVKALRHTDKRDGCNVGDLFCYYGDVPQTFGGNVHRKADKALTKTKNISSIYIPDPQSNLGYGDMKGTADALLFIFHNAEVVNGKLNDGAVIEIFVARGMARDKAGLYNELSDGMLDDEIEKLRKILSEKL